MRLCAHVRLNRGIAKHLYRNRIDETYSLTPECMLDNIAYKTSESINASSSCLELLAKFLLKDIIAMLFLLTTFALESRCKDTNISRYGKIKKMPPRGNLFRAAAMFVCRSCG